MALSRRRILKAGLAAGLPLLVGRPANAQTIDLARIVLGFPAGGSVDTVGRRIADKMHPGYARSVIVENRVGGGGQVATIAMKTAPSDGSTMLMTPMSILGVYPHTYRKLPYDPLADLRPVSRAVSYNFGFAVGPAVPDGVRTIPQFMEWCKATPGKASFGSAATGSTLHFTGILLGRAAGVEMTYVGYRGSGAVLTDVAGGALPACVLPIGDLSAYQAAGKVRVIGTSGAQRSRFLPHIPTFAEMGYRDMVFEEWYGFYLPARASQDQVQRLHAAVMSALKAPDVVEALNNLGLEANPSSPAELGSLLKADHERWGRLVKSIGFTADS
ncbi:Bug family tripartite tricarboxylate transporter substrate binding protein [Cupriavidus sp. CP313]